MMQCLTYLYTPIKNGSGLYKINKTGKVIGAIKNIPGGAAVWTGEYFWVSAGYFIEKWFINGTIVGKIYPAAMETTALAWDGSYLWGLYKTCELWDDQKIFQIEIINETFVLPNL